VSNLESSHSFWATLYEAKIVPELQKNPAVADGQIRAVAQGMQSVEWGVIPVHNVTSHPGQLSLAIPLWVGALSTSLGWEGNRRSGVALSQTLVVYPPTGSTAYEREMSTPPTLLRSMVLLYLYLYNVKSHLFRLK